MFRDTARTCTVWSNVRKEGQLLSWCVAAPSSSHCILFGDDGFPKKAKEPLKTRVIHTLLMRDWQVSSRDQRHFFPGYIHLLLWIVELSGLN